MAVALILKFCGFNSLYLFSNASRSSYNNRIYIRHLRGPRYSKDSEDLKYQELLRNLKNKLSSSGEKKSTHDKSKATLHKNDDSFPEPEYSKSEPKYSKSEPDYSKSETEESVLKKFEERMIPYKDLPYTKELKKKYQLCSGILKAFGYKLQQLKVPIAIGSDRLPCPVDFVLPSPVIEAYRNKDNFSIGIGLDGTEKTVGFLLDNPSEFSTTFCIRPEKVSVIKEEHKIFAKDFEYYIQSSPLPAMQQFDDKGFWKNLIVKSNINGDLMGIVVVHPQDFTQDQVNEEKKKLKDYFSSICKDNYNLHSLYFQTCSHSTSSPDQSPFELLFGETCIVEELNQLKLSISPGSFFYINSKGAESMHNSLLKLCKVSPSTTVLDINCGIGSLSLMFSPLVKNCIGMDESVQSIGDAKLNCDNNSINNVQFLQGRPEHLIKDVLQDFYFDDVLTVINSTGCELSKTFMNLLRESKHIQKIIYITNRPQFAINNFVQLCRPAGSFQYLGKSFLPILALPVDLHPRTEHIGLVIMFQRL